MRLVKTTLALAASSIGVALLVGYASKNEAEPQLVIGHGYPRWPAETLVDWVGFADQVSVVTIESERQLSLTPDVVEIGEGYVGREVTARIEKTIWSRPQAASVAGKVRLRVAGWAAHDRELRPFAHGDGPRIEVGERFIAALLKSPEGEWSLLSAGAAIPLRGTGAELIDRQKRALPEIASALDGKDVQAIAKILVEVEPESLASKHSGLDADARAALVNKARLDRAP